MFRECVQVQLLARDSNGLTAQRYLSIEICDEDDNDPEFPIHSNGTVKDFTFYIESGKCRPLATDCNKIRLMQTI